jgi:hypothetical protein
MFSCKNNFEISAFYKKENELSITQGSLADHQYTIDLFSKTNESII